MSAQIPETMIAIAIKAPGRAEELQPEERPVPQAMEGELLVKVEAAGINRPDVLQRQGSYPPPKGAPDIPGLEIAGTVVKTGRNTSRFKLGEKVCALVPGGGYAEYCAVHESNALPVPSGLSMVEAAALPETFFTVWSNVFERGGLKPDEYLLVHGGTSGIGTTAIMLATALGSKVIATAGSQEKCAFCEKLGALRAINYNTEDFPAVVKEVTNRHGADVILDMVGGDYIERNYEAAAVEGRIVQIAFLRGADAEVNFTRLMLKRLTHTGSTLRARDVAFKAAIARALESNVWPLLEAGKVKPIIHETFPLREAAKSHALMETNAHMGKIILTV